MIFMILAEKNSLSANIMQPLSNNLGNVSLSALWRNYWGRSGNAKDYQFSYSNNWQHISYTFSASQSYDENNKEEERFNLFISIPFYWGMILPKHVTKLTYRIRPHFPKMAIPPTILELLA